MPITYEEVEQCINEACEDLETQEFPNIAQTAHDFDVPEQRLRRRFKGKASSKIDIGGQNKVLDEAADAALCLYIDKADDIGLPIREKTLVVAANAILRNHHSGVGPIRKVSKMWASRWLTRHPEYQKKTKKPLSAIRKNTHDSHAIQAWFDKLLAVKEIYGVVDTDIYNMDETGFRIGVGRGHKVITKVANKRQYLTDPDNRDYITFIESISAGGVSIAPMIIVKAANLQERWIVDSLNDKTSIACSESGYSNDDINVAWLRHFNRLTKDQTAGMFRLLLLDGFASHIEYDFVEFALHNRIILFGLSPHTTHFLQPLDVVCFQPLKHYHGEAIDAAVRTGDTEFSKIEFLASFEEFRKRAFKSSIILSAFRKTGIVPHNPKQVIAPLQDKWIAARRTQHEENQRQIRMNDEIFIDDLNDPLTPTNVNGLHMAGDCIERDMELADISPTLQLRMKKYIKGATTRLDFGAQIEKDLEGIEAAQAARKARKSTSQRQVIGGGIFEIEEARKRMKQRLLGDEKKKIARFKALSKRARKPFLEQFEIAAAQARNRIRELGLQSDYLLEI